MRHERADSAASLGHLERCSSLTSLVRHASTSFVIGSRYRIPNAAPASASVAILLRAHKAGTLTFRPGCSRRTEREAILGIWAPSSERTPGLDWDGRRVFATNRQVSLER